ncbi:spore germination protein [Paenisporosarcina macmurdoensis]|uniref:Spore germination protein n=1 Tax=Paenisporosarcina macmurdoensis TaxID=212659 RepID=A0ABW1L8W7_9BACL
MESFSKLSEYIKELFHDSSDLVVREIDWPDDEAILCHFSVLMDNSVISEQLNMIQNRLQEKLPNWGETPTSSLETFHPSKLVEYVCAGESTIILVKANLLLRITLPNVPHRAPMEPGNEIVVQGPHDGFVESMDVNIALVRKRLLIPNLVVRKVVVSSFSKTPMCYMYIESKVNQVTLDEIHNRLRKLETDFLFSTGQIQDELEDNIWSPFPQLMTTERPDKVATNLMEGKVVILVDQSPTALLGPVTFFSFYQSPDDYNGRVLVGSFFRLLRIFSFLTAIFLPAFYIAIVSFHFEVLPLELSKTVKTSVNEIPYRPFIEAMILEITIELIREASIRLPSPVGQTIGIVGGLVIGDAIVSAGLVSNLMVIVVALTAISSFVVPSNEMNMSIRLLRYPFMIAASLFGFFGIVIGTLILFIHLTNLRSLTQPYFYPVVPFKPSVFKDIFFRRPFPKPHLQATSFTPKKNEDRSKEDKL